MVEKCRLYAPGDWGANDLSFLTLEFEEPSTPAVLQAEITHGFGILSLRERRILESFARVVWGLANGQRNFIAPRIYDRHPDTKIDMYATWRPILNDNPDRFEILRGVLQDKKEYPDEALKTNEAFRLHLKTNFPQRCFSNSYALDRYPNHCIVGPHLVLPFDPEAIANG